LPEFEIHTVESAPEDSRKLLRALREQVGFVPNLAATMAESPTLLEAFLALRSVAARSSLDAIAREVISIAAAFETGCSYCVAAHSTLALKSGAAPNTVEAVRSGATPSDPRLQALVRFARTIVQRQDDVTERGRDLLKAGLTSAQILEILVVIMIPMLASSVVQITAVKLDGAFQPQAWASGPSSSRRGGKS
jgi:uncharacterized peroxidase-related enzyme